MRKKGLHLYSTMYHINFYIIMGEPAVLCHALKKLPLTPDEVERYSDLHPNARGRTIEASFGGIIIWLEENADLGIIVHEVHHASWFALDTLGSNCPETHARMSEWLFNNIVHVFGKKVPRYYRYGVATAGRNASRFKI